MIRTDFEALVCLTRAFVLAILLVPTMAGPRPTPGLAIYSAAKTTVSSFADALHDELRPSGITVTELCSGGVATQFAEVAKMQGAAARIPRLLISEAEDCA